MRGWRTLGGLGAVVIAIAVLGGPALAQESTTTTSSTSTSTSTTSTETTTTTVAPSEDREPVLIVATAPDVPRALDAAGHPPVLVTGTDVVPPETIDAIKALRPERIIVVGDTATVSDPAFAQLEMLGADRIERVVAASADLTAALDKLLPPEDIADWLQWSLFGLVLFYIVVIFGLRVWLSTIPRASAIVARDDLLAEAGEHRPAAVLLASADDLLRLGKSGPASQRDVLAAWRLIHDADRALVPMRSVSAVRARAAVILGLLVKANQPEESTLRKELAAGLRHTAKSEADTDKADTDKADTDKADTDKADTDKADCVRAPLAEALRVYYDRRDDYFENLASWDRRLFWLTLMGLAGILAGGFVLHRETLFLAGAIGGVISRMTRAQRRRLNPADYGLSWSMLMLSPVVGALAGWAGSLIVNALASADISLFNVRLVEGWDHPLSAIGLTVALVLGFSERLLKRLFGMAEDQFAEQPGTDTGAGSQTGGSPRAPQDGGGTNGSDDDATTTPAAPTSPTTVTVPDVAGIQPLQARAWLEALGLRIATAGKSTASETPSPTPVADTSPRPGTVVEPGTTITLRFADPPPKHVEVPDVVGRAVEEVMLLLQGIGLSPVLAQPALGHVVVATIEPTPGAAVPPGTPVVIFTVEEE